MKKIYFLVLLVTFIGLSGTSFSQETRLLRQPSLHENQIAFCYGGDIWLSDLDGQQLVRITSTQAVERDPYFSPDGKQLVFTSNRSGVDAVYVVSAKGGTPKRLTWYPSDSRARGWTPDGKRILYSSSRETAPIGFYRLWTVSVEGGPSKLVTQQWGTDGCYSPDLQKIVIDRVSRWESEFRAYRGGQNTPLIILDLKDTTELLLPNESTIDIQPLWLGENIYFLSDRDGISNIWSYNSKTKELNQITSLTGADIKSLSGFNDKLVYEREGYLHLLDLKNNSSKQLGITVVGDFPWAETKWKDVSNSVRFSGLSPTGKRAVMEARGEVFTIPVEHGDVRNLTKSNDAADRAPIWSPKGDKIAWFSDANGKNYSLMIASQDGLSEPKSISIGISKMAWEPVWSPDGEYIAFTDDDVRVVIIELSSGKIINVDVGGNNLERGGLGLIWSPDSKWLAYSKSGSNGLRQIMLWSQTEKKTRAITNSFADAFSPSWDRDGKHLYFLASTDVALGSGWANTSAMTSRPEYAVYVMNLDKSDPSPFELRSDEEDMEKDKKSDDAKKEDKGKKKEKSKDSKGDDKDKDEIKPIKIDFEGIERRILPLPMPVRNYQMVICGPKESVFVGERVPNKEGLTIHKFDLKKRESKEFVSEAGAVSISFDGKKMLARINNSWKVMDTDKASGKDGKSLKVKLKVLLDRQAEWKQIFEEAWRYERDYFYDPNLHGRDWNEVYKRYAPLIPYIKHRGDLTYILDQMNGELSVGHSFVFGGDYPEVDKPSVGLLGADLEIDNNGWKIKRIYTTESWNPKLSSPLDQPGIKVKEGNYLVGVNGKKLTAMEDPYKLLDGTNGIQTVIHLNTKPDYEGSWKVTVKPIGYEGALRQRAWVEDSRRLVDKLSNGKLAYVWIPNTSGGGLVSFNRYFFAQQDKLGAVIDERFNGGGLLDDYMVDLMTRKIRAAITNEVPNGKPMRLPAGILGPKVLLINEMSGSGGDFFPWVFRQQKAGQLIGATTWGGLVKSSVHYSLVDGGALTAPDNAVFDPVNKKWIAENTGVAPDIFVRLDAKSLSKGIDPQLERAVREVLKLVEKEGNQKISPPAFSTPAVKK